ncbi:MAG: hypothetical protein IJ695_10115 [Butyrivibrio sp.]|nr:hypothetical protein [Butyrivibrio sp.]
MRQDELDEPDERDGLDARRIAETAIRLHNKLELPEGLDEKTVGKVKD